MNGLCNGSRMTVINMSKQILQIQLIGGDHHGQLALISRIALIPPSSPDFTFRFKRQQFPVRLAFAITINRAQGQSVAHVGLDLHIPVFAHGQLCIAHSRVIAKQNIQVLLLPDNRTSKTTNIVYQEALLQ